MAIAKCTAFYQFKNSGWSTTFYKEGTSLSEIMGSARTWGGLVRQCGSRDVRFTHLRGVFLNQPNATRLEVIENPAKLPDLDADVPWTSILVRVTGVIGNRRMLMLRGQKDSYFTDGRLVTNVDNVGVINALEFFLHENDWGIYGENYSLNVKTVASVDSAGTVTTVENHDIAIGHKFKFLRTRTTDGRLVTGIWTVMAPVTTTSFKIAGWEPTDIILKGKLRRYDPIVDIVRRCDIVRAASRRVGRPFGQQAGRRSRRAR